LVRLLATPGDIPVLAPLAEREILYRLLHGEQASRMGQIAFTESKLQQVNRAISWIKRKRLMPLLPARSASCRWRPEDGLQWPVRHHSAGARGISHKRNFREPFSIDAVATEARMSSSALHQHFKAVTAMSPLRYQKQLRLQEARRLILTQSLDASTAAHTVGYESPSQFSREYRRLFGAPPVRDIEKLRTSLSQVAVA
jgi:AraC-like DNA-binding protein